MIMKKLSMLFFIIGSLICLFSGSFPVKEGLDYFVITLLVVMGVFIGTFNISKDQEKKFLIASIVFIASTLLFKQLVDEGYLIQNIALILNNFVYFLASAALVVSLKVIVRAASEGEFNKKEPTRKELAEDVKHFDHVWNTVVFVAVAFVFIIFVLQQFFEVGPYEYFLDALDFFIWVIFVIDLIFLYSKAGSLKNFFKKNYFDLIAVLDIFTLFPLTGMLQGTNVFKFAKMARMMKIVSKLSKASKVTKVTKVSKMFHATKFFKYFSKESGFNEILEEEEGKKKPSPRRKSAKKKTTKSVKKTKNTRKRTNKKKR